jgi:hypothetical protein
LYPTDKSVGFNLLKIVNKIEKLKNRFKKRINSSHYNFEVLDIINTPLPLDDESIYEIHCHMLQPNLYIQQPDELEIRFFQEIHRVLKNNCNFYFSCDSSFFRRNSDDVSNDDYDLLILELEELFKKIKVKLNLGADREEKFNWEVRSELEEYTHYTNNTRFYIVCTK